MLDRFTIADDEIILNLLEIQKTTISVSYRAHACLKSDGEHFENLINKLNITFIYLIYLLKK